MNTPSFGTDDPIDTMIQRYADLVYKLAYAKTRHPQDAEDIFQEVFLRYIQKQPIFQSAEHEKAWFIRVTVNCSLSALNSSYKKKTQPIDLELPAQPKEEPVDLSPYLDGLPPHYRVVIHLFYYEDLSTAQISQFLRVKESTVRMRLTRARKLLRAAIPYEFDKEE